MAVRKAVRNAVRARCICAWCGRERSDAGTWQRPGGTPRSGATVTHGICPDCVRRVSGGRIRRALAKKVG